MSRIAESLSRVRERIAEACKEASRKEEEVTLIAVSKTRSIEEVMEAYRNQITDFGENKVVEILEKQPMLIQAKWHMIGHLQRNKVRKVLDKICMLHSLDSVILARQIQKQAESLGIEGVDCLIELNMGMEESKFGLNGDRETLKRFVEEISVLDRIRLKGLMTVAPFVEDAEINRPLFSQMRELALDISANLPHNSDMHILSMGMSNDFEAAIKEGATMIRIGTDIFGDRNYTVSLN